MLYSYKNQFPDLLPGRLRTDSGSTITSLELLSRDELYSLGFTGPYVIPSHDPKKGEKLNWNGVEFFITREENQETIQNELQEDTNYLNFDFYQNFKKLKFYSKLRESSLSNNVLMSLQSELNVFFSSGKCHIDNFETHIKKILMSFEFSNNELQSLFNFIEKDEVANIRLNDIKCVTEDSNHEYDFINDRITHKILGPFKSWTKNNDDVFIPPVEYPLDGNNYVWDEFSISWSLVDS